MSSFESMNFDRVQLSYGTPHPPAYSQWPKSSSKEFTILRPKEGVEVDTTYLWAVLRSAAIVAEWLSGATGVGRHRVDWDLLKNQLVPLLSCNEQKKIGDKYRRAQEYEAEIRKIHSQAQGDLSPLELEGKVARDRLERAKPPH
jgi:type I restriction enzyme M protein